MDNDICRHALHCVLDRQRPRTKLACSDCILIICWYIWSLSCSSGWRVRVIVPKFYASELTLIGYVRTHTTIPKVADELWHYSWLLLLLALYWVPGISGFISTVAWRWSFWTGVTIAGLPWPFLLFMPETYAPVILKRRAQNPRKETGDASIMAPIELEKTDISHIVTVVLTRPIRMICFEPLVLCSCIHTSYAYSIFYIFQAYPIIYTGIYDFNAGEEGLTFLPIGIGASSAQASTYSGARSSARPKRAIRRGRAAKRCGGGGSPASRGHSSCSHSSRWAGRRARPSPGSCPPSTASRSASVTCACS